MEKILIQASDLRKEGRKPRFDHLRRVVLDSRGKYSEEDDAVDGFEFAEHTGSGGGRVFSDDWFGYLRFRRFHSLHRCFHPKRQGRFLIPIFPEELHRVEFGNAVSETSNK
ncbi:hypothetical protein HS088_TW07G00911 [Tripterygium wilfordii]|uniref:Uncharacterized protein n=1 Tax=Tripterygium wilfordii TaxID=458696 RepID=A0A7J7DG36_TRIWF|nr:uncharacterized protein LOC120002738 [Tripterygium wilfordii]KAF5745327.1 hypothetical protein HS088_TW07G00911 [Tripterygium wilfordii]